MVTTAGPMAHVPELPGYVQYCGSTPFTCNVDLGMVQTPDSRDPDPKTGEYISEHDAYLPAAYSGSSWNWYVRCLPLPCSKCGLKITHSHALKPFESPRWPVEE